MAILNNLNTVRGLSLVSNKHAWELDEVMVTTDIEAEKPLIKNLTDWCSSAGYGAEDPVSVVNRHLYSIINGANFCIAVACGFRKAIDFKKLHSRNGVLIPNVFSVDLPRYGGRDNLVRKAFDKAETLAEDGRVFIFITPEYPVPNTPPQLLTVIEKGEKPFSTALKRVQINNDLYCQYVSIDNGHTVRSFRSPTIVGRNNDTVLVKSTVYPGKSVISSHKVLYCRVDGGERLFYAKEIHNESPCRKLVRGLEEFIREEHPELVEQLPLEHRKTSKGLTFENVSVEVLTSVYEFMDSKVTSRFERDTLRMFPQMNSIQFIDNVVNEINLDMPDVINNINSAFDTDYTIDFVTGETITESEATYILGEGYTMDTDGYVLCVNDDEYHEERSCTYYNGDWYTNTYFNDNFEYCHNCDDYYEVGYGCSCGGGCEDILLSSDADVLDHCGKVYMDVDKDQETIKHELSFKKKGVRTYGLEIEYSSFNENDRDFVIQETMILKSDGTSGVTGEINTLPFTFNALQDPSALDELWSYLKRVTAKGGEGDVTQCGIHVHVSRDSVSDLDIAKFECLINSHHERLSLLARRDYFKNSYTNQNMDKNVFVKPREKQTAKYQPVNYQHSKTFEIRIFRSNLRSDRVRACVEFVEFGLAFVKTVSVTDLKTKSFEDLGFLQALNRNSKRFKNLHELAVSKGLLDKKPTAKQS